MSAKKPLGLIAAQAAGIGSGRFTADNYPKIWDRIARAVEVAVLRRMKKGGG
jgi:hypothetical protein